MQSENLMIKDMLLNRYLSIPIYNKEMIPQLITITSHWARWRLKAPASRLFTRLFRRRSKKTTKRVTGFCEGNSPVIGELPAQGASNAENVSIWWRHRVLKIYLYIMLNKHMPQSAEPWIKSEYYISNK